MKLKRAMKTNQFLPKIRKKKLKKKLMKSCQSSKSNPKTKLTMKRKLKNSNKLENLKISSTKKKKKFQTRIQRASSNGLVKNAIIRTT